MYHSEVKSLAFSFCIFDECKIIKRQHALLATSGNITDEVILEYIKNQDNKDKGDEEFTTV